MYNLAQEAYGISALSTAEGRGIVSRQLINHFVEGLAEDSMKMKVMRRNPQTLEAALEIALGEQNLLRRFNNLGTKNKHQIFEKRDSPMEVDHNRRKRCPVCMRYGHTAAYCRQRQVNAVSNNGQPVRLCYFCRSPDHLKRDCEAYRKTQGQYRGQRKQHIYTQKKSEN